MGNWIKQQNGGTPNQEGALQFKEHREFFIKFFEIRDGFTNTLAQSSLTPSLDDIKKLYEYLYAIVEWTTPYILNVNDIDIKLKKIEQNIFKCGTLKNKLLLKPIVSDLRETFRLVNKDHEKNELIPRLQIAEKDPWADEGDSKKKVMYKVVMEMFRNV